MDNSPPPPTSLYTLSFFLALLATLLVASTLRLLAILPNQSSQPQRLRKRPLATRILVVLGSGGHTHEMLYLLRDLDTKTYTHRSYIVSSGDAFSAQRAVEFEAMFEARAKADKKSRAEKRISVGEQRGEKGATSNEDRMPCVGPDHYNVATLPRARQIHQPLYTTPITSLHTLYHAFSPILSAPPLLPNQPPQTPHEAAACDLPDLIITNGPATAVIVILASLVLKFFNIRGAQSRRKCRMVYVESFARVKSLSLSGKLLVRVVDRFLVQWEELEGVAGGRAEFWGILV
ncbi:oligosaccharide biosynthesis protein Alg14 like protein [Massarina eburnea CBS 473.64]|uniref:UDP-N-acetylglucosamine transferase subunit ALG14 n=1 Tax=Massarina eburnea CBS 473.64 TaxID=1395130 RepID=A0A6A6RKU7_9PLEO|nr:oligosaccharide biosynthesis protein Alg14 like protein [Massarina eburnea CBS 473.64]